MDTLTLPTRKPVSSVFSPFDGVRYLIVDKDGEFEPTWFIGTLAELVQVIDGFDADGVYGYEWNDKLHFAPCFNASESVALAWLAHHERYELPDLDDDGKIILPDFVERWASEAAKAYRGSFYHSKELV